MRTRIVGTVRTVRFLRALILGAAMVAFVPSESSAQMAGLIKDLFDPVTINPPAAGIIIVALLSRRREPEIGGAAAERLARAAVDAVSTRFLVRGFTFSLNPPAKS